MITSFTSFENLTGGTGNDSFVFSSGASISGNINGVSGTTDKLDYSSYGELSLLTYKDQQQPQLAAPSAISIP